MSRGFTFTVPGDPTKLSKNARLHYLERHRLNQLWRTKARTCWVMAGRPRIEGKVRITFTLRRGRKVDPDNHGCHALVDGLKDEPGVMGMLVDDGPDFVEYGPVEQEVGKAWKERPEVVVTVEEA